MIVISQSFRDSIVSCTDILTSHTPIFDKVQKRNNVISTTIVNPVSETFYSKMIDNVELHPQFDAYSVQIIDAIHVICHSKGCNKSFFILYGTFYEVTSLTILALYVICSESEHHFVFKIYLSSLYTSYEKQKSRKCLLFYASNSSTVAGIYMFNTGKLHIYHTTGIYVIDEKIGFDFCRSLI